MKPKQMAWLALGILFVIIVLQNTQVVSARFLFWKLSMSGILFLPLLTLFAFATGFFVGRFSED